MKFGLLYELQTPRPWTERSEYETYHNALAQIKLADAIGIDYVWEVEHHFLAEYSHSPAPEVFLAAVSQHTTRIRIGHGVCLLPKNFNHPVRIAERIAALDILSNGRVDFGCGRSSTEYEIGGFEVDPAESRPQLLEAMEMIPKMWMSEVFRWEGKYYNIPPREVIPKPLQKPHPPMWMACTQDDSFLLAGQKGIGALAFDFKTPHTIKPKIDMYKAAIQDPEPVGALVNNHFAACSITMCLEDETEAVTVGQPGALYFLRKLRDIFRPWKGQVVPGYEYYSDPERVAELITQGQEAKALALALEAQDLEKARSLTRQGGSLIGTPAQCIERIHAYREAGADQLILVMQLGHVPHEKIMQSLRILGDKVLPHCR